MHASEERTKTPSLRPPALPSGLVALRLEITKRYAVQLHMILILAMCFGAGLVVTKLLLMAGIGAMWLRYLIALAFAYVTFLVCIRLWLAYAGYGARSDGKAPNWDWPDSGRIDIEGRAPPVIRGGGGFGGAGASGTFADSVSSAETAGRPTALVPVISGAPDSRSAGVERGADLEGGWSGADREGGWSGAGDTDPRAWVLIPVIALLAAVFGAAIYLVYLAPTIMSDAAFAALLSAGLVRSTRRIGAGGWVGSAIRDTWRPFAVVFVLALAFALVAQHYYPDAQTLADILDRL